MLRVMDTHTHTHTHHTYTPEEEVDVHDLGVVGGGVPAGVYRD